MSGIYTITNLIDGKIYVGHTTDFSNRKWSHFTKLKSNSHDCPHLQSAINLYGIENFIFEELVECEVELLASEEHYWAMLLNVHDRRFGYNSRPTSPNGRIKWSQEVKDKISKSHIGIKNSPETRSKIAISNTGKKASQETKLKMSLKRQGRKLSEKHRQALIQCNKDRVLFYTDETRKKYSLAKSKPVIQLSKGDIIIKEWPSLSAAAIALNIAISNISQSCLNQRPSAGGFKWKFKNKNI